MNVATRIILVAFACLFLAEEVLSVSATIVGDVRIVTQNNGSLNCDSMICPKGTAKCHVTKRNDPNNFDIILRHRRCIDANGKILQEEKINEPNKFHGTVNVNIDSGGNIQNIGRPLTPQEQKELNEYLQKTQQQVQSQLSTSLGPFLDGSFATNLQNQISNSLHNVPLGSGENIQNVGRPTSMGSFLDGTFATNLQNQISNSLHNAFNFKV